MTNTVNTGYGNHLEKSATAWSRLRQSLKPRADHRVPCSTPPTATQASKDGRLYAAEPSCWLWSHTAQQARAQGSFAESNIGSTECSYHCWVPLYSLPLARKWLFHSPLSGTGWGSCPYESESGFVLGSNCHCSFSQIRAAVMLARRGACLNKCWRMGQCFLGFSFL